ncbi:LysR substrate-binding domain-containing protein [Cupriavidus basilensis]|uniref:LysR substrate-binding domain-containing protein n=1 Tax=Cupriavidus basilensis TaxID=68895 RepID=A0ABT6B0E7_9BURK|nr:LysR substrate-binding domain-containing protein [Cupriavidus basilensis]MDF3838357.1 LysR substrate-binding domain-containing protein [Cupriavidus basilensis]
MRLRHLEVFHAVMRTGSLSRAAQLLCVSQPAASKVLAHAERDLGLKLFKRAHGRLLPTREAELLYAETGHLFANLENVRRLARNLKRHPEGHVRLGCLPSLGLSLIPQAVRDFRLQCPGVSLEIQTRHSDELLALVLSRELDLGVVFDPPARPGVAVADLGRAAVVYLGPQQGEAAGGPVHLAELDDQRWIGIGSSDPLGGLIAQACHELGLEERTPMIEARTYYVAAALAECGVGYALVDQFTAQFAARGSHSDLTVQPVAPALSVGVTAIYPEGGVSSRALDALLDVLRAQLAATLVVAPPLASP